MAAAAAILIVAVVALNRGPGWTLAVEGTGTVEIDGVLVSLEDRDDLLARLRPGVRLKMPANAEITLVADRTLALLFTSGSDATIPPPPARWLGRASAIEMWAGEVRISTGVQFGGARIAVATPNAAVEITGTTIAVILDSAYTCVCVLEGTAGMGEPHGRMTDVSAGMRRFLYRDHSPSRVEPIDDMQRMKLTMFRDASGPRLGNTP